MPNTKQRPADRYASTAPATITTAISEFGQELGGTPVIIPHHPQPFASFLMCKDNCELAWRIGLGTPAFGWSIWQTMNFWLAAEFHCVLRCEGDEYVDITPFPLDLPSSGHVCFVPTGEELCEDNLDSIDAWLRSKTSKDLGRTKLLNHHPLVRRACELCDLGSLAMHANGDAHKYQRCVMTAERLLDLYVASTNRKSRRKSLVKIRKRRR